MKNIQHDRWALPDLDSSLISAAARYRQNIFSTFDPLGEYARSPDQAISAVEKYLSAISALSHVSAYTTIAVKPSALGLNFDKPLCKEQLLRIFSSAAEHHVSVEIDIEGTPTVSDIIEAAHDIRRQGFALTLALQAYLDRTPGDVVTALGADIKVRLVKGAYRGDTDDFSEIQHRFFHVFLMLHAAGVAFDVGTHDPEILAKIESIIDKEHKKLIGFGFLKGLADQTKVLMAEKGMKVCEYLPFGPNRTAYEARRKAYLQKLESLQRSPAP